MGNRIGVYVTRAASVPLVQTIEKLFMENAQDEHSGLDLVFVAFDSDAEPALTAVVDEEDEDFNDFEDDEAQELDETNDDTDEADDPTLDRAGNRTVENRNP